MESDPQGTVSRTTAYRRTDQVSLLVSRTEKAQGRDSTQTSNRGSTSRRFNRLLQRDDRMDPERESHPEHPGTDSESTTEALGTTVTHETQAEIEYLKSTIGRRAQSEKRMQLEGLASLTDSTADRRKGRFPETESRTTPFPGSQLPRSRLWSLGSSPRTNSKAQGSRDSHMPLTSLK